MAKKADKSKVDRAAVVLAIASTIFCASTLPVYAQSSAPSWNDPSPAARTTSPPAKSSPSGVPATAPQPNAAIKPVARTTAKYARPWLGDIRLLDGKPLYGPPKPQDLSSEGTADSGIRQSADNTSNSDKAPWLGDVRLLDGKPLYGPPEPEIKNAEQTQTQSADRSADETAVKKPWLSDVRLLDGKPLYGPPSPVAKATDQARNKGVRPSIEEVSAKEKPWLGDVRLLEGKPLYGPSTAQVNGEADSVPATSSVSAFAELNTAQLNSEAKALMVQGLNAAAEGDWQNALTFFLSAASSGSNSAETFYHVGVACYHLGKLEHARTAERIAIGLDDQFLPSYIEMGTIECKLGHYREAREVIQEALGRWPGQDKLLKTMASIRVLERRSITATTPSARGGNFDISPLSKPALLFNAKDVNGLFHDSELALQQGDLLRAKTSLQFAVTLARQDPEPHWRLCNVLEAEGDTHGAVLEAKRAVALDPTNPQWYLALGWAYSRQAKWDLSYDAFREAYTRDNSLHDAIVGECYALAKQKQFMLARITLHISDPAARDTSWFHAANGLILQEKGELTNAYKELKTALEISPNDYQIKYVFARVSYQLACKQKTQESWKVAARDARALLAITPYDVEVLINLGICQKNSGDNDGAAKTLARTIKISPSNAGAHAAYASVLAAVGRTDEAKHHARLARKIDPSQKLAETVLQKLK